MKEVSAVGREYEAKRRIADTLREMLKHNDIDEVRVTKLCEKAGVSRRAFYNYFNDIYGVIPWIRKEIMKDSVCHIGRDFGWHKGHERMFEQYRGKMIFKKSLNKYDGYLFVRDILLEIIRKVGKTELTEDEFIDIDFYTFAVANIINKWGNDGMVIPPARMADICQHYIPEWLIELFGP